MTHPAFGLDSLVSSQTLDGIAGGHVTYLIWAYTDVISSIQNCIYSQGSNSPKNNSPCSLPIEGGSREVYRVVCVFCVLRPDNTLAPHEKSDKLHKHDTLFLRRSCGVLTGYQRRAMLQSWLPSKDFGFSRLRHRVSYDKSIVKAMIVQTDETNCDE